MVKGLEVFSRFFADYKNQYVVIGGTACDLNMNEFGLEFRGTRDIDIVLFIEALTPAFSSRFWEFIKSGQYENRLKSKGKRVFYRFYNPKKSSYPEMLELFSLKPIISGKQNFRFSAFPLPEEIKSLSAILMDRVYYGLIRKPKSSTEIMGIPVLLPEYIIPLKAKAYLDLTEREAKGEAVDSADIKKHRNDILRLFSLLDSETKIALPVKIKKDMSEFLDILKQSSVDLSTMGIRRKDMDGVVRELQTKYSMD